MKKVAVLGFGTVGSGVVELIAGNGFANKAGETIAVKHILDLRDFPDSPFCHLVTHDFADILNDTEVDVVVETMGGLNPAYQFTKQSLLAGKSVVTSNKELVSTHGAELLRIAREKGVNYLFEASVGGGIPIIRPLANCLAANDITHIMGILNGTTNYILTQMIQNGATFEAALLDAQQKGYAERNPEADVEGHDSCRKIAILSSLAYGKHIESSGIPTEGITNITLEDVEYARAAGYSIKLIGQSELVGDRVYAKVAPMMLPKGHPLAEVEDVFNAILVKGSATGDVMFYGKGAGKLPTASAVVADVIDIVKHKGYGAPFWEEGGTLTDTPLKPVRYFIRLHTAEPERGQSSARAVFGKVHFLDTDADETVFFTEPMEQSAFASSMEKLVGLTGTNSVRSCIQVI